MKTEKDENFIGLLLASGSTLGIGMHTWSIFNDSKVVIFYFFDIVFSKHTFFVLLRNVGKITIMLHNCLSQDAVQISFLAMLEPV